VAITRIPVGLAFHMTEKNTTIASIVNPSVVEDSTADFLPQEDSLSVQPAVEVKHSRFYCYNSESGDSDKSIYNSGRQPDGRVMPVAGARSHR